MKKLMALLIASALMLSLAGCGEKKIDESQKVSINYKTLEGILTGINEDFTATSGELTKELEKVHKEIGGTFEGYEENCQKILDWYDLTKTESEKVKE